jgi:hypothetical protein
MAMRCTALHCAALHGDAIDAESTTPTSAGRRCAALWSLVSKRMTALALLPTYK